jgi:aquaporin Z
MKKYVVEFIGTLFLVLAVCMAGSTAGPMAPVAIGVTLMGMVYAGGYISGAHYNPAVSLAIYIRGKLSLPDMFAYWVAQLLGGALAALIALKVFDYAGNAGSVDSVKALIAEILGTFALAYVVLNAATTVRSTGNSKYGLAIGFTVTAMAYTFGPISGGAFNPAVALGASIFGAFEWSNIWIYLAGTFVGGALAGFTFNFIKHEDD